MPDARVQVDAVATRQVPLTEEYIERIRREVREDRFFRGNLVSEDETAAIAERLGATVYQHDRTGGIADPARRFAVGKATGDWIFILDADEMIPPSLATHLRELIEDLRPAPLRVCSGWD